jgi:hypothetical protein
MRVRMAPGASTLERRDIHADDAVFQGGALFRRSRERIEAVRDADIGEPGGCECGLDLCLQQSAGNSTGPQIDIASGAIVERGAEHDVGELQASPRGNDTKHLSQRAVLIGHEIEYAVRHQDVNARIVRRQRGCVAVPDVDVREVRRLRARPRARRHRLRHVDADRSSRRTHVHGRQQQIGAGTAPDVEHGRA